jgi:hypothetical protein
VLTPEGVAAATVRAVERNREVVFLPWTVRALYGVSGVLPRPAFRWLCDRLGVSTSMAGWRGHGGG